jgi:methylated-DNA-protein-cysteine methyltransferase-like protein
VYALVKKIPPGKVATYGQLASALHTKDARRVGHALHANPDGDIVPCHRVVFSDGHVADGYAFGGPKEQLRKLKLEGVSFINDTHVDLQQSLFPLRSL